MPTSRSLKVVLALSLLVPVSLVGLVVFGLLRAWWSTPISVFGFVPGQVEQPIEFPHPVHVEEAGIQCDFCHRSVAKSEAATVPPLELCVACHRDLPNGTFAGMGHPSVEHVKELWEKGEPLDWKRVHRVPDHVQFMHEPHLNFFREQQGLETQQVCSLCHGDVGAMNEVRQVEDLKMRDCVDCHKQNNAPTDCVICHY